MNWDTACWAIPQLVPYKGSFNNQICLLPYKGTLNPPSNIPSFIHLFDPFKTGIVQQHIKYPPDFDEFSSHWFHTTCRKETRDLFILDFMNDVHRVNMDSLKWQRIAAMSNRPRHRKKSRIFMENDKCNVVASVIKYGIPDKECYKIWEINEKTNEFDEICCSECIPSLPYPWESTPVLLNKSNDVLIICDDSKHMQFLKFCRSNGCIDNIKLNDTDKLIMTDFSAEYGHVVLRDDIIILFEENDGYNKPWINIVDIKKGSITKSLLLPSATFMDPIHAVLIENIAKEELLVHGYCKDNSYTLPLAIAHLTTNYYANESILFIMNGEETIRYAVCEVIDIFVTDSNLIDNDKRHLKFTNALML